MLQERMRKQGPDYVMGALQKTWDPPLSQKWGYEIRYDSSTIRVLTYSP